MNHTPNFQLTQWERSDRILMEDFNADNAKIDAALAQKAEAGTVAALQTAIAAKGNCQIAAGSYMGSGTFGSGAPNTLRFPFKPSLVILTGGNWIAFVTPGMVTCRPLNGPLYATWALSWSGTSLSWYVASANYASYRSYEPDAECQMNKDNTPYYYIIIA